VTDLDFDGGGINRGDGEAWVHRTWAYSSKGVLVEEYKHFRRY